MLRFLTDFGELTSDGLTDTNTLTSAITEMELENIRF